MRIVSLLPAATDIVASLGMAGHLVGRTHECDWPAAELTGVPVLTGSEFDSGTLSSREISDAVGGARHSGSALYTVDTAALAAAAPDLVLTQDLCDVCAVSYETVSAACRLLDADTRVLSLEPRNTADVLGCLRHVGEALGVPDRAAEQVKELHARLANVRAAVAGAAPRRVAALEWLDPLWPAGHWVPEQLSAAGGLSVLAAPGAHTEPVPWDALIAAEPAVLALLPCGFPPDRTIAELPVLTGNPQWTQLSTCEVWVLDGPAYFNRPGPRIVRGAEILAWVLHGIEAGEPVSPAEARRLR